MGCDLGEPLGFGMLFAEGFDDVLSLAGGFLLWMVLPTDRTPQGE
jgi:hypothetical protein